MKILVAVKRVVDYAVPTRVKADKSGVEALLPKFTMNPFDEIALEEAVRIKERGIATEILAVSMGPSSSQDTLRSAMALGADRALHVACEGELQPLAVARLLAALVRKEAPVGLLMLGKQAIDGDSNQAGQMAAALLNWPQATFASRVVFPAAADSAAATSPATAVPSPGGGFGAVQAVEVTREVDGGTETLRLALPAVITADLRLNTPRFATLPNTMRAKRKPIEATTPADLGVDVTPQVQVVQYDAPPKRKPGVMVKSVAELVQKLRDEAKVI